MTLTAFAPASESCADAFDFVPLQTRVTGKAHYGFAPIVSPKKPTGRIAPRSLLLMQRYGKVHLRLDPTIVQKPHQIASVPNADHEQIVEIRGRADGTDGVWQLLDVSGRNSLTLYYPMVEMRKLNP
jgi:hypothetical protein